MTVPQEKRPNPTREVVFCRLICYILPVGTNMGISRRGRICVHAVHCGICGNGYGKYSETGVWSGKFRVVTEQKGIADRTDLPNVRT